MTLAASSEGGGLNPMSFTDQHGNVVLERMRYQRATGRFCDVQIVVKERQFPAHRNILASCSPYFDSILKSNKVCKEQVTVNCQNPVAFELLLNYMYSGSVVIDRSSVSDLLKLANNFLVTKLKNYCAEYLDRYLDAANCLSVRQLAAKYNLPSLLKAASEYFDVNINRCLLESVDILQYSHSQITRLLEDPKYYHVISPDVHLKLCVRWVSEDVSRREGHFASLLRLCSIQAVSQNTLHFLLDYAPLLANSPSARLLLLNTMQEHGMQMDKYESQLGQLREQTGLDHSGEQDDLDGDLDDPMSGSESTMDAPVDGHPTTNQVLEGGMPALKLKINLGDKLKRKAASNTLVHRRKPGRPPKRPASADEVGAAAAAALQMDDDELDGVYADAQLRPEYVTYGDPDRMDPNEMEEDEEEPMECEGGAFACHYCKYTGNTLQDLERHAARRHHRNTVMMCPLCEFESNWSAAFYEHVQEHFQGVALSCDMCDFVADQRVQDLLTHRLQHNQERLFKCAECGFRARTRTQLWAHDKMHSLPDGRAHHCDECGRGFQMQAALDAHVASHDEPRPLRCDECGFMTREADHLVSHKRGHNADMFYCHIAGCDYSSPKKSQLAAHLRTHMAVRAHMCKTCGRGFIEKSHLVRHERIHLEDKPFKCDACEYASSRRDKLKEHILKHHNGTTDNKTHRRRYRRAKQIAALAAQAKALPSDSLFRPIDANEQVEQWQQQSTSHMHHQYSPTGRAASVSVQAAAPLRHSPGSMSLININLAGPDTPLLAGDKDVVLGSGLAVTPLVTPVPRSPHNHSDPFACQTPSDMQRPMSLPPYTQQQQQQHNQWMWPQ